MQQILICSTVVLPSDRLPGWGPEEALGLHTYCKNVIFSSRRELLGRHHASLGLYKKLALLIPLLDAVGDFSIRSIIAVGSDDPIHWVSLRGPLLLRLFPLWELDLVDLLQKQRPVVIVVEDLDDDADGGGFSGNAVVGDGDLSRKNKDFRQRRNSTDVWDKYNLRQRALNHIENRLFLQSLRLSCLI